MAWQLHVSRIDNRLVVSVNGVEAFNRYYDYDPALNIVQDLSALFNKDKNAVMISGYNGAMLGNGNNPWHFQLELIHNNNPNAAENVRINEANASVGGDSEKLVLREEYLLPQ